MDKVGSLGWMWEVIASLKQGRCYFPRIPLHLFTGQAASRASEFLTFWNNIFNNLQKEPLILE